VNAADPAKAVQQATAQLPGKKPGQVVVGPKTAQKPMGPGQKPMGSAQPTMGTTLTPESTAVARLKYPYGIVVPGGFVEVIRKAVQTGKRVLPGIMLGEAHGRITIQIEHASAMVAFVSRLEKNRDRRAKTILEGIKGSA
jgi:hypothetical protein